MVLRRRLPPSSSRPPPAQDQIPSEVAARQQAGAVRVQQRGRVEALRAGMLEPNVLEGGGAGDSRVVGTPDVPPDASAPLSGPSTRCWPATVVDAGGSLRRDRLGGVHRGAVGVLDVGDALSPRHVVGGAADRAVSPMRRPG